MSDLDAAVAAIRGFSRFYTRRLGLLGCHLGSGLSLTEMRVRNELATREGLTARALAAELGLDPGQLSRLLTRMEAAGHLARREDAGDRRRMTLSMTADGREAFMPIDRASREAVGAMVAGLDAGSRARLVGALRTAEAILSGEPPIIEIRPHRAGDVGAVISAQAALYADEYGWNTDFEAAIAEIGAGFLKRADPRERAFIAEANGRMVGAAFSMVASQDPTGATAQLRMLHVDVSARGSGLGRRLVRHCLAFARKSGFRRMTLWTNDVLVAARGLYAAEGFVLEKAYAHHAYGKNLVGEIWARDI